MTAREIRSDRSRPVLSDVPEPTAPSEPECGQRAARNNRFADFPRDRCLHELFEEQAERTPDAVAVEVEDRYLTYAQLNACANRLALCLCRQGVGPETRVGLCTRRSVEMVVGLLAILKAGAAYMPIDPMYPPERVAYMCRDARVVVVLTYGDVAAVLNSTDASLLPLEGCSSAETVASEPHIDPATGAKPSPQCAAYVLYTSGSTGRPKGVVMSHEALVNLLMWQVSTVPQPGRTLQFASIGFDVSFHDIFMAWNTGGTVVLVSEEARWDPSALLRFIDEKQIETINLSVAVLQQLALALPVGAKLPSSLRRVFATAEQLQITEEIRAFFRRPDAPVFYNHYGPTEAHVVTYYRLEGDPDSWASLPSIGRPIANTQIHILNRQFEPVPAGDVGELYIAGVCLARGYLNRPDMTAEKFIPNPHSDRADARMYRTGDMARLLPDGNIEYLGRSDLQVKIRGFRVEPGEIESVLWQHPGVREAVVVAREDGGTSEKRLVGYLVAHDEAALSDLRAFLRERLPDYMIPSAFVRIDAVPLTTNGKVDRRALPAPEGRGITVATDLVEPRTSTETWLVNAWQEALRISPLGIRENYFELGGHSLMAVRIFDRIQKELGRSLSPATLFQAPTIEQLAAILDQADWKPDWKCLVAIRPNGSRPPFFMIHGALAHVLFCHTLARYLPKEIPLFGIQSLGLDGSAEPLTSVEEMAEFYIHEIQSVQPTGPYYVGGLSFGGIIAFDIAQRLQAQGQEVGLLAMVNSPCPVVSPHFKKRSYLFQSKLVPWVLRAEDKVMDVRKSGLRGLLRRKAAVREEGADELVDSSQTRSADEIVNNRNRIFALNRVAERAYRPRRYAGRITLFYAAELHPHEYYRIDTRLAWSDFATGGLEVQLVPGNHGSMRHEPHAPALIARLTDCLNRAYASAPVQEKASL